MASRQAHTSNKSEAQAKFHAINQAYKVLNQKNMYEKNPNHEFEPCRSVDDNFFLKKPSFLSRSLSRRSKSPNPKHSRSKTPTPELDRNSSSRSFMRRLDRNASRNTGFENITSWNISSPITPCQSSCPDSLRKTTSRRGGSNPIIYSQSTTVRRKPPPIEKNLECTLEQLCHGSVKNIKITRHVIGDFGMI
ncbi:hypothetical protein QQ045_025533 [Rhodiola kirilowii]